MSAKYFDYLPKYSKQLENFLMVSDLYESIRFYRTNYILRSREIALSVRGISENLAKGYAIKQSLNIYKLNFSEVVHSLYLKKVINVKDKGLFDEIRIIGNRAAHGGDVTAKDCEKCLVNLDKLLRKALYTLASKPLGGYPLISDKMEIGIQPTYTTFERKLIYIQSGTESKYDGLEKIGDASVPDDLEADFRPNSEYLRKYAKKRINQYMNTAGVPYELHWAQLAVDNHKRFFRDYAVHEVLKRSGFESIPLGADENGKPNEWFKVTVEEAKEAINAVKEGRSCISDNRKLKKKESIKFRPEQRDAINKTKEAFKGKKKNEMLWNAKMRFGKTLSALQVILEGKYKKVLIMTHRPVVRDGWFEDFGKIFKGTNYEYGSKDKGQKINELITTESPFVYFASIQDLRGSKWAGGAHDKNLEFLKIPWDFIIIDEAHEGNETKLANRVKECLKNDKTKILELSGTPFNLLDKYDEDNIFTWDYTMEQEAKYRWESEHPNEPNPYEELPKVSMYTFDISKKFNYVDDNKAFNFKEFFRVENDELVYKDDVMKFLDEITTEDNHTNYPYSNEKYRNNLRHTLWLLPGVKEANALEKVLKEHLIFQEYEVINVVRTGDDGYASDSDLQMVRKAIGDNPAKTKTITLTVRKLTTGVNVKEWTGVFFLNNTESPTTYLQAAFRAQTPFSHEELGIKQNCYVFDFAPDRALKIMSESIGLTSKKGKINSSEQKEKMTKMLNFLPIIGQSGNKMVEFNVDKMLTQLKKVYAEKAVRSGFEDNSLYNDNLLGLGEVELSDFKDLRKILEPTKKSNKDFNVIVSENGFGEEEYEEVTKAEKKPKNQRSQEEEDAIKKLQELRKQKATMISILRGVSVRIPMMIYGMEVDLEKDISVKEFINKVDLKSWEEFMPKGLTKEMFKKFTRYYDNEIFIEAGRIIRQRAKSYDKLDIIERTEKIAELFGTFKNPDKETVLTPWRVVNLQLISTIGGLSFYDNSFSYTTIDGNSALHWVEKEEISNNIYKETTKVLDINSKTGLYPLFMATSLYYKLMQEENEKKAGKFDALSIWKKVLKENIYAITKTKMARTITKRTLAGYEGYNVNVKSSDDLLDLMTKEIGCAVKEIEGMFDKVKFDVVIGNPPYHEKDGGAQESARPLYPLFVKAAKELNPRYISLIIPTRWYTGGKGGKRLDEFRKEMLTDTHIRELHDLLTPGEIFPNTNIRGGVCYFLWDKEYDNHKSLARVITYELNKIVSDIMRPIKYNDTEVFIRDAKAIGILEKILKIHKVDKSGDWIYNHVSASKPFGFRTFFIKDSRFHQESIGLENPVLCYGNKSVVGYVERSEIQTRKEWIDRWKVLTPYANNIGTELKDDNFNTIIAGPNTICTETYLVIGADLDLNKQSSNSLSKYLQTKFSRYLQSLAKSSQHGTRRTYRLIPLQDYNSNSDINWNVSVSEIDIQLYKKYKLTQDEISHIEGRIKSMQ